MKKINQIPIKCPHKTHVYVYKSYEDEDIDSLLSRFKKEMKKHKVIEDYKYKSMFVPKRKRAEFKRMIYRR